MLTASPTYLDLVAGTPREWRRLMLTGSTPDAAALAGREFRGTNVPATSRALGIRRFIKGFESAGDGVRGYNRRVRGSDLSTPWAPRPVFGRERFGYFTVTPVDPEARDNRYLHALLLDYGAVPELNRDPSRVLRDYLVQVDGDVLLGQAFLAVGRSRVPVGYFVLEPLDG